MRLILTALLLLTLTPAAANAEGAFPKFAKGTLYTAVRARLIRLGIDPVPVRPRAHEIAGDAALRRIWPELMTCAVEDPCNYLFRRRSDRRLWIVSTDGEADFSGPHPRLNGVEFSASRTAGRLDLRDVIIASPAHRDRH
jgi:hypothetical protein